MLSYQIHMKEHERKKKEKKGKSVSYRYGKATACCGRAVSGHRCFFFDVVLFVVLLSFSGFFLFFPNRTGRPLIVAEPTAVFHGFDINYKN